MKNIFAGIKGARVRVHERLAKYTSFKIGGPADYFITVSSAAALKDVLGAIKKSRKRYLVIGAGTNLLFSDRVYHGVVVKLAGDLCRIKADRGRFLCGAGALLRDFLKTAAKQGYGGAENLAGIPGTIGGAIKGNAGAFGKWISQITERIAIIDNKLSEKVLTNTQIKFGYRRTGIPARATIIQAEFKMSEELPRLVRMKMRKILRERRRKHPSGMCAGSFFKNPLPQTAGQLIDECGLKGRRIGDAMVSTKHGNFIMNAGNARASDVLRLARLVKRAVRAKKGILLKEEVRIIK